MDVLTPAQRRKCMQKIKSKDTSIEVELRKILWHKGYRYRKNFKALPGSPDIVLTKQRIAIFCDSDFFHGKNWVQGLKGRLEKGNNPGYWTNKIERNIERDIRNNCALSALGWTVIRFWGSEIKKDIGKCVSTIEECIFERMVQNSDMLDDTGIV